MQYLRVQGLVQGVGFRPLVYRLACELGLQGRVYNTPAGVCIELQGDAAALQQFEPRLQDRLPVIARIDRIERVTMPDEPNLVGFCIQPSQDEIHDRGEILPDLAPCADCLAELFDPRNRRWRYPFINCTRCGPRYSILRRLPYDRHNTSMAMFPQCPSCLHEYDSPADRRFHAQPNTCSDCGPSVWVETVDGVRLDEADPLVQALDTVRRGEILALKGVGGFHLICDARNPDAIARLRQRKQRPHKPFAIMAANTQSLDPLVQLSEIATRWLTHPGTPIVIAPCVRQGMLPNTVAPGLNGLGVMLPQSPLHWLLFHEAAGRPVGTDWLVQSQSLLLVMTSANLSGEPLIHTNADARTQLRDIADRLLLHDRDIVQPQDDPVISVLAASGAWVRRGRGVSPQSIKLAVTGPPMLALGGYLKTSLCLSQGPRAWLSPPLGDLASVESCRRLQLQVEQLPALYGVTPAQVSVDLQPDSYGYRLAQQYADARNISLSPVQHHHAHVAAVMAEHQLTGPVIGLSLDGLGLGEAGELRGGELLKVNASGHERLGALKPLPLPGGDRAAREPWRLALALLFQLGREDLMAERFGHQPLWQEVAQMLRADINCPPSNSLGRLFDAVAGLMAVCDVQTFEAQAAMLLEAQVRQLPEPDASLWRVSDGNCLDLNPLLQHLLEMDNVPEGAECFHANLIAALAAWAGKAAHEQGIRDVILSGGCLLNGWLRAGLLEELQRQGLTPRLPIHLPPGDGALSLGQVWVSIMRANIEREREQG